MIRVAVLMSTYNGEKYVAEQIDSILNQKGDFYIDIYVRDDGSQDNTINILNYYKEKGNLDWYTGENLKPARSFYDLLLHCRGYDYYAFSDQDDFWKENKIQRGIDELKEQVVPALYCSNADLVDEQLESLGRTVYRTPPRTDFETVVCAGGLLGCTMVFNEKLASAIIEVEKFPQMVLHDFYVAALCVSIGGKIVYDTCSTMKYRQHGNNVVGVSHGLVGTIWGRIKDILYREPVGIANQADGILYNYKKYLTSDRIKWLLVVAHYKDGIINRIKLACSSKTKYINKNIGIKLRLSILLGNR